MGPQSLGNKYLLRVCNSCIRLRLEANGGGNQALMRFRFPYVVYRVGKIVLSLSLYAALNLVKRRKNIGFAFAFGFSR